MKRIAFGLCVLALSIFVIAHAQSQEGTKKEGETKKKEGGKKGKGKPLVFESIDEKAHTLTVKAGEKGSTTYSLTNPFKVVRQADEGQTRDAKVADLKSGQFIALRMNAEGKAVEVITILRQGRPEGKEAPAPKRPEGKESPAPKRPEGAK